MSRLLDEDQDNLLPSRRPERELTLSTGAILGIFLALVLLCGTFFGVGYKLGAGTRQSSPAAVAASIPEESADGSLPVGPRPKPAAGSLLSVPDSASIAPTTELSNKPTSPKAGVAGSSGEPPPTSVSPATSAATQPGAAHPALGETAGRGAAIGAFVVQVAAVSHQEDADLLVSALRSKGYAVAARPEAGDKLVHIQIGPFKDRVDADAMRQRLAADGYNAFVK